jgi:hypothetical protein
VLRRERLSLPYGDQVPLLARLLDQRGHVDPPSPRRLVAAAIHHNVAGYLVRAVRAGKLMLPPDDAERVTSFSGEAALQTAVLRRELSAIAAPLEQACEVPPLLIKGPAVADFYPDWRLRPCADLDLLVPKARLDAACRSLEDLGYERLVKFGPGYAERYGRNVHLRRPVGRRWWVDVELHWRVGDDPATTVISHERLRRGAGTLQVDGTSVAVPGAPAHLIVLAIHLLCDLDKRLAWVNDLVLVGRALAPAQWEEAFATAEAWGLLWPLHRALDYPERHLRWQRSRPRPPGPPLPWGPLRAVEELSLPAAPHLGRLAALGWRERVAFLRAVLVPTRQGLQGTVRHDDDATTWQLIRRHARRALAGLTPPPGR